MLQQGWMFNISHYQTAGNRFSIQLQYFTPQLKKYVEQINQSWQPDLTFTHEEFGLSEADLSMSRSDLDF